MSSFCICKSYSYFFSKNTCELGIVLTRIVNILTINKLVKLTILWTTGSWWSSYLLHLYLALDKDLFLNIFFFLNGTISCGNSELSEMQDYAYWDANFFPGCINFIMRESPVGMLFCLFFLSARVKNPGTERQINTHRSKVLWFYCTMLTEPQEAWSDVILCWPSSTVLEINFFYK